MKKKFIIPLTILTALNLWSWGAYGDAPVMDDSENFSMLEYTSASVSQPTLDAPLAHEEPSDNDKTLNNLSLMSKIDHLQHEVQELRGQLEIQSHNLDVMKQEQLDLLKEFDHRLAGHGDVATSSATAQPSPQDTAINAESTPATAERSTNPAQEQISYMTAYELINSKHYDDALPAMQLFIARYPHGGYTANAHYWIGELHMVKKNYTDAIAHFEHVLKEFPSSSKSSASMLKIGYALAAAGELQPAKQRLQAVIQNYPDTHAAQLALAKLELIGNR